MHFGVELLFFDRDDTLPRPAWSGSIRRATGPTTTGTCLCRGSCRDRSTAIASKGSRTARGAVRPRQGPARPLRAGRRRPEELRPRRRRTGRRQRRHGDEERGCRFARVRLGGRRPALPARVTHHHLRDARPRIHSPSQLWGRRENPGHVRGIDREDPLSPRTRHHRRRAASGVRV